MTRKYNRSPVVSRLALMASASLIVLAAVAGPAHADEKLPPRVLLATSVTGSLQNTLGTALAKVVSNNTETTAVIRPFSGTTTFFPMLNSRELDFGIASGVDFGLSYLGPDRIQVGGENPYPEAKNLRLVMGGSPLIASFIVRADSDIHSVMDMKGKRVAGKYPAHLGARINLYAQLAGADIALDDLKVVPFSGIADGLKGLVDGRVDVAAFGVGGAAVREADAAVGVRFINADCTAEGEARLKKAVPGYYLVHLKAGSAPGIVEDICTVAVDNYIVTHKDTPPHVVKAFIEAIWDNIDDLPAMHPQLRKWNQAAAVPENLTIPVHPAAIEFYQAEGAWDAEDAARQRELLAIHAE